MHKKFKIRLVPLLLFTILFTTSSLRNQYTAAMSALPNLSDDVHLVLDTSKGLGIPKNFRKTSPLTDTDRFKNINITGLGNLNISGSAQFSQYNLPLIIKEIGTPMPKTVIDLRQEAHGFINGLPVSWANGKNNANVGLSREEVLIDEAKKLSAVKLNVPINFYNHPERSIIPKKVESENDLVKSNALSYIRIPVTDGRIPTDDMVDYFTEFVKAQPQNTWLHFHCKEGVGRTTTFMILYDIMKNCKEVSFEDIVYRQLLLANFKEQEIQSFKNPERMSFLENFYKYCKETAGSFSPKWSVWKKNLPAVKITDFPLPASDKNVLSYTKNKIVPASLYVISLDKMTPGERTMISTLQGAVNSHCSLQIYTLSSSVPDYKTWLEDLRSTYKIPYKIVSDPWQLLDIFKGYIDGYVLFSSNTAKEPSINNACTLASLKNCIAVDESLQGKVKLHGITEMVGDCRNTGSAWAFNNLWNCGLNHFQVVELSPDRDSALRDYAILTKSLVFYEDSINDVSLRTKIFSSMEGNSICLGWGPDEFINVSTASKYGVSIVPADWSYNLTVLSAFPSLPLSQKTSLSPTKEDDVHHVTFVMSDGDNQQWYLGNNYGSSKWFGSPYRGKFNMGWSISPSLYYLAPTVFSLYYKNAGNGNFNDYFMVSPSGNGYIYPSKFDKDKLDPYIEALNNYMKNVDQKYAAIIDDSSFYDNNLWDKFTSKPDIWGLFYLDYHRQDNYHGEIRWSNNKPLIACRDLLWEGLESEDELVNRLNLRVKMGEVNKQDPKSYTFVYVHAWSKDMKSVANVVGKLKENSKIRVVTPERFMELIKSNLAPK